MNITEVRIKLLPRSKGTEKLRAFCTVTLADEFVIRDLKIIEGAKGTFIAMPSRKLMEHCSRCGQKNPVRSNFCSECGSKVMRRRTDADGRRLYVDVAHPINAQARAELHDQVMVALLAEEEKAMQGNYIYARDDDYDFEEAHDASVAAGADDGGGRSLAVRPEAGGSVPALRSADRSRSGEIGERLRPAVGEPHRRRPREGEIGGDA